MSHISRHRVLITRVDTVALEGARQMFARYGSQLLGVSVSQRDGQLFIDGRPVRFFAEANAIGVEMDYWKSSLSMDGVGKAMEKSYRAIVAQRQLKAKGYNTVVQVEGQKIEILAEV